MEAFLLRHACTSAETKRIWWSSRKRRKQQESFPFGPLFGLLFWFHLLHLLFHLLPHLPLVISVSWITMRSSSALGASSFAAFLSAFGCNSSIRPAPASRMRMQMKARELEKKINSFRGQKSTANFIAHLYFASPNSGESAYRKIS